MKEMTFIDFISIKEDLVEEGGKAVENVIPIKSEWQKPTYKDFEDNILKKLLGLSKKDYKALGSTFKKLPGQSSGDMDISVGQEALAKSLKIQNPQNVLNELYKIISMNYPSLSINLMSGFGIVSVAWPITSDQNDIPGNVQIDLMLSSDIDYSSFVFHSPDFTVAKPSQFKGLYRTELLKSIFAALPVDRISKRFEDEFDGKYKGDYKQLGRLMLDPRLGLKYQIKSFEGKRGKIKTGKNISQEVITKSPQKIVNIALGPKASIKDVDSFESLWKAMKRPTFPFNKKAQMQKIVDYFVGILQTKNLPIPQDIVDSKYFKLGK